MGGGGGSSSGKSEIRYAGYIEAAHSNLIYNSKRYGDSLRDSSPYSSFIPKDYTDSLYGAGYTMASFPALFDIYGKFIAGIDVEYIFNQVLSDVQNSNTIHAASQAHNDLLTDTIEQEVLPRFQLGMRDMNAVISSTYVIGKSIIEQGKIKKLAEFDADMQYKLIPIATEVFAQHLKWNQGVVSAYLDVIKFATIIEFDTDSHNFDYLVREKLWPFTVLSQERANIGALNGAAAATAGQEASTGQKVVGGMASGAAIGSQISPGWGTVIGGVVGGIAGYFS